MPSPIAHSLLGAACGFVCLAGRGEGKIPNALILLGFVALANAPDLDFLPGIVLGELNRFHHGPTHSLLFVIAAAVMAWLLWRVFERVGIWVAACLATCALLHLGADLVTVDRAEPIGIPFAWPVSHSYFKAPVDVFLPMRKDTLWDLFHSENLTPALRELLLTLPFCLVMALLWWSRWGSSRGRAPTR